MLKRFLILLILFACGNLYCQIVINEFSAHKGIYDENNIECDWIEIYNNSNQAENLSSFYLTDDLNELEKWPLPEIILMPYQRITFFASGKNTHFNDGVNDFYHTNFKLSPSENIALYNGNEILDSIFITNDLYFGLSMGKYPDGSIQWCYFDDPTPNSSNTPSICFFGITNEASLNIESGWYENEQTILMEPQANSFIFYTTDGSIPSVDDIPYTQPFNINENTIISYRSFSANKLPSKLNDRTFIFEENNHQLPVFSIHTEPNNLWSDESGIYVSGPNPSQDYPYYGSNFWQPWSKFSRIEYFDDNKDKKAEEIIDLEIHGGWSRAEPQKSFRIDLKSKYTGRLEEAIIPAKSHINSYNNFNLRNGGQHTWSDKIQDALISRIAAETNVNYMAYQPCIVYLNGEYWGVYGIREKIDEHYIEDNYGFNSDSIDLLNSFGVLTGTNINANNTYFTIINENPESDGFYELFSSFWNVDNYMDYFIIQSFIQNMDWLGIAWGANNIKLWRPQIENGKWSYVLYDTDGALGYFGQSYYENYLAYAMNPAYVNNHSQIFNHVLNNHEFKCKFSNRYADLINTSLSFESAEEKANIIKYDMYNAMPRHIERWQNSNNLNGTISSMQFWENSIDNILNYYSNRIGTARYFLDNTLNLDGMVNISLDILPNNSGRINLNTLLLENFPWEGVYYNGCEISLTAIPDSGYSFSHWSDSEDNIVSEQINLLINLNDYQDFKANFIKCEDVLSVSIYFSNNNIYSDVITSNNNYSYQWYQNGIPYSTDTNLIQPVSGIYNLQINSNECSIQSNKISFQSNVNILEHYETSINLYPNPFINQAILDLSRFNHNSLQIKIVDNTGKTLREYKNIHASKLVINRGNLSSGVYILEIKTNYFKHRKKIVVN